MEEMNKKIEGTINSLEGLQRAEDPAFFHTRVYAELEKKLVTLSTASMPIRKPVWVIAILMVLLAANVFLLTSQSSKASTSTGDATETASLQGFANSYGLTTSTGY